MPFLAALAYWWRVSRRDIHPSLKRRYAGGFVVWTLSATLIEPWFRVRKRGLGADAIHFEHFNFR
jgi:hypothetical protein